MPMEPDDSSTMRNKANMRDDFPAPVLSGNISYVAE